TGAGRSGVYIALLRARILSLMLHPVRRPRNGTDARRERVENWIEMVDGLLRSADHHAIAALEAPHASRGADIDIVDALVGQQLRPADIVLVETVAAIDDDVAR